MSDAPSAASIDFVDVYRRHSRDVFRFAMHLCGNADEADDLTSETFVRAWTTPTTIVAATVRAYLFTITRRLWMRRHASASRHIPLPDTLADGARSASTLLEQRDALDAVQRRLATLPDVDRAAIGMRAAGLSYREIAVSLGLSEGAARVRVHRARAALAGIR